MDYTEKTGTRMTRILRIFAGKNFWIGMLVAARYARTERMLVLIDWEELNLGWDSMIVGFRR